MPNATLEMAPLNRSSHSIPIDCLPSLSPGSDKKDWPLVSRVIRVENSALALDLGSHSDSEAEAVHKEARLFNLSPEEAPVATVEERNIGWKSKALFALCLVGAGTVMYAKFNGWDNQGGKPDVINYQDGVDGSIAMS